MNIPLNCLKTFDFKPVQTELKLLRLHYHKLKAWSEEMFILDLGKKIPIFRRFDAKYHIEDWQAVAETERVLFLLANAYKTENDDVVRQMLKDEANKIRKRTLGSPITNEGYDLMVEQALENNDTIKVEPNSTIRFLVNPHYRWREGEYSRRFEMKNEIINSALGLEKKCKTKEILKDTISDYDLAQKRLNIKILSTDSGIGYSTVKQYLAKDNELKDMLEAVKRNSGTKAQLQNSIYNSNKKKKHYELVTTNFSISKMAIYLKNKKRQPSKAL